MNLGGLPMFPFAPDPASVAAAARLHTAGAEPEPAMRAAQPDIPVLYTLQPTAPVSAAAPVPAGSLAPARPPAAVAAHVPAPVMPAAGPSVSPTPLPYGAAYGSPPAAAPDSMPVSQFLSTSQSPPSYPTTATATTAAPSYVPSVTSMSAASPAAPHEYTTASDAESERERELQRAERERWESDEQNRRATAAARDKLRVRKPGGGGGGKEYEFAYDRRLAWIMVPAALILMALGGKTFVSICVVGLMITYLCDALRLRTTAFVFFWCSFVLAVLALDIWGLYKKKNANSFYTMFLLINANSVFLLIGIWISLHLPFVTLEVPELGEAAERVLFAAISMPASALIMWAIITLQGIANAPYYYIALSFIIYRITMTPLPPSAYVIPDAVAAKKSDDVGARGAAAVGVSGVYVCGSRVSGLHTLLFVFLPAGFYLSIYKTSIFSVWGLCNVTLLVCIPALLLTTITSTDILWWTGLSPDQLRMGLTAVQFVLSAGIALCLEYRVIIYAFSSYLAFHATNPALSYLLLTTCIFSALIAFWLAVWGLTGRKKKRATVFKACIYVCAFTGALCVGVQSYLVPFVFVAAYAAVNFYFNRRFTTYALFLGAFTIALLFFIRKAFWFLQVQFTPVLSLQAVCLCLTALFILALLIPGFTILNISPFVNGALLTTHAIGVAVMEYVLYEQNMRFSADVYPPYLLVGTSVAGIYMAHRLHEEQKITDTAHWLLWSLFIGKLGIFLAVDESIGGGNIGQLFWMLVLSAAIVSLFFTVDSERGARGMTIARGLLHASLIVVALFCSRRTLLTTVLMIILKKVPNETNILGAYFLATAIAFLPLSFKHFNHMPSVRRANTVLIAIAVLFAVIQPRTDVITSLTGGADVLMETTNARWPAWLLFAALTLLLISLTSILPMPRLIFALTLGTCLGLYVCGLYVPFSLPLYGLFVVAFNAVAVLLVYLHWPTPASTSLMGIAYAVFVATLPLTYLMSAEIFAYAAKRRGTDMLVMSRITLFGTHAALHFIIALCVKLNRQAPLRTRSGAAAKTAKLYEATGHGLHRKAGTAGGAGAGAGASDGSIDVTIGNFSAFLSLSLGMLLNMHYFKGSETGIFVLAPILLLLNADSRTITLRSLTEERRYFPIVAAICLFLFISATFHIFIRPLFAVFGITIFGPPPAFSWWFLTKNYAMLLASMPSQLKFLHFLWSLHTEQDFYLLCVAPLNLLPILLADLLALKILGVIGIIGCVVQMIMAHQIRRHGLEVI